MKVYGDIQSGNCYKVALVCALLDIAHDWIAVDVLGDETSTESFLAKNPNGKIPVIELDDGRSLWESNAIVNFLARDSHLLPDDSFLLAKVQQWQFFEQYSHEPYIAVARFIAKYLGLPQERRNEYESLQAGGHRALGVLDAQLQRTPYLIGECLTTADISLYAYTHVADEGGFDLREYAAIQRWLAAIAEQPGYIGMD
ncbi:MAG: glutathione S-transferase family protein [Pseudomonadota bacterium]